MLRVSQILGGLGVLGQLAGLSLVAGLLQLVGAEVLQALLAGHDVHGQLLEVAQVLIVQLVQHGDVLQKLDLMLLQALDDLVDVDLGLVILGLQHLEAAGLLLEQPEQAALLLLVGIEALELHHQVGDHVAHLVQVLGAHVLQRSVGELGDVLLRGRAVGEHQVGVAHVDLLGEVVDHLLLRLGEVLHLQRVLVHLLLGLGFRLSQRLGGRLRRVLHRFLDLRFFAAKGVESQLDFVCHDSCLLLVVVVVRSLWFYGKGIG